MKVSNRGKAHQLVASQEELLQKLRAELSASKQDSLIVMAGHFMLFIDDESGRLVPGIMEEQSSDDMRNRIARRVGIFPRYTWDLGVELAEDFRGKFDSINILLLINDWQYVPANGVSPSQLRRDFYEQFTGLPDSYRARLERSAWLSSENVLPSRKHPLAFPETWLKYRFQKSAEKFVKRGKLEKRVLDDATNDTEVSFLDENGNYKTLISCGVTG